MKTYRITYAWTFGDIVETIQAETETEARNAFLNKMYDRYDVISLRAACFKILHIEET